MQAHLAKYRKLMPALALLFSLADNSLEAADASCSTGRRLVRISCPPCTPRLRFPNRSGAVGRNLTGPKAHKGWKRENGKFTVRDVYRMIGAGLERRMKFAPLCESWKMLDG